MSDAEIQSKIKSKFYDYQYNRILEEDGVKLKIGK